VCIIGIDLGENVAEVVGGRSAAFKVCLPADLTVR
jgi:hypothetical protein